MTGRKTNGFFIQSIAPDTDALTSEGLFVFTNTTPQVSDGGTPRLVAIGDVVQVTGRVVEFKRSADARPETLTELSAPLTVVLQSEGQPLPDPLDAATVFQRLAPSREAQLER